VLVPTNVPFGQDLRPYRLGVPSGEIKSQRAHRAQAPDYFRQVLASDVADVQGAPQPKVFTWLRWPAASTFSNGVTPVWRPGTIGSSWGRCGLNKQDRWAFRFIIVAIDYTCGSSDGLPASSQTPSDAAPIVVECRGHTQVMRAGDTITVE
jgi:hypothetical protein